MLLYNVKQSWRLGYINGWRNIWVVGTYNIARATKPASCYDKKEEVHPFFDCFFLISIAKYVHSTGQYVLMTSCNTGKIACKKFCMIMVSANR